MTPGSASFDDPHGSSVIVAAVSWLESTLLGTVATTIAVIAVATVGLMMLTGRVNIRFGVTVVVGSFVLFGARTIVAGIQSLSDDGQPIAVRDEPPSPLASVLPPPSAPAIPANNDPYAGASVPSR